MSPPGRTLSAVRLVALFEGFKGVIVLAAASGFLLLLHKDVHALAVRFIAHTHLNPAAKYPQIFLDAASNIQDPKLILLAVGAAAYSAVRLAEAYGLFRGYAWAEVLAAGSGAIYLPFEILGFIHHPTAFRAVLFLANVAVVAIMIRALVLRRRGHMTP
ncbi:hypothetical protein BWI17_21500 [Betaproteobacteria bacterium GR16-43]|nr:hypothetical protein BWI17_21500 [Betaproteobacteria bacterium GR16-43]